jgi:hypothetical protein
MGYNAALYELGRDSGVFLTCVLMQCLMAFLPPVMDLRSMGIDVFSGEVIPLCRRLGSRVAALGA